MEPRPRVLIAAQPEAFRVLHGMLVDALDPVPAYKTVDALATVRGDPSSIALIICTVRFDESRMLDFLQEVKQDARTNAIPFVCCRVLPTVLSNDSMDRLAAVCRFCGADDFIDIAMMEEKSAAITIRNAVMNYIEGTGTSEKP
jgi:hypothetical protein